MSVSQQCTPATRELMVFCAIGFAHRHTTSPKITSGEETPPLALPLQHRTHWQTGAPSELVAVAGATGVTAPMKIAQLFDVLMFVIDAVQPACVPVPVVIVPSVLPVVVQNAAVPAVGGLVQLVVATYFTESAK